MTPDEVFMQIDRRHVAVELRRLNELAEVLRVPDLDPATWEPGDPLFRRPREVARQFTQVVRPMFQILRDDPPPTAFAGISRCRRCDVTWYRYDAQHGGTAC